jgi:NAD(P)-dependent dehydrogenase (short-subunit alcohol dehydrogenase family)
MNATLSGKRALITGASSGIGLATARMFAEHGAVVFGLDRRWSTSVDDVESIEGDVTSGADVVAAVAQAAGDHGLDILVANAGIHVSEDWRTADPEAWARVFDVNVLGVMRCFQAAAADMVAHRRKGRLLATASVAGLRSFVDAGAYCASKAAVISLVKSAALAFVADEITVNAVAPGSVDTEMLAEAMRDLAKAQQRPAEDVISEGNNETPMRRRARPEEIAGAFLYLASDAATYVTGETICVDGGMLLM